MFTTALFSVQFFMLKGFRQIETPLHEMQT